MGLSFGVQNSIQTGIIAAEESIRSSIGGISVDRIGGSHSVEVGERALSASEMEFQAFQAQRFTDQMRNGDKALQRLQTEQQDLCEFCGQPIPPERRAELPATTSCVACARKLSS
jgi:RNA polymerase-binding transcription factor DksA